MLLPVGRAARPSGSSRGDARILTRNDGLDGRLSLPVGAGLGLTTDELGLPLETSNPYRGQRDIRARATRRRVARSDGARRSLHPARRQTSTPSAPADDRPPADPLARATWALASRAER